MNNLSCYIVDDEPLAVESLSVLISKYCPHLNVSGSANSVSEALEALQLKSVDILFLDIRMQQETGFDLLEQLEENQAHIIFVTAHDQYGIQAIKFSATDYLLKPVRPEELISAVHKVGKLKHSQSQQIEMLLQSYQQQKLHTQKRIALADQHQIRYVLIEDIVCCSADNSYTSFYLFGENGPIVVSKPISDYEQILLPYGFLRVHQSWLISTSHIQSFKKADGGYLIMGNKMSVPVSRQRRHLLKEL